jgi:hypothetical protein
MSDEYYREQAARRSRVLWLIGAVAISIICLYVGFVSLFRDDCTQSYDRSPEGLINSYVSALVNGDIEGAQSCWEHDAYYELESGCSEMCLSRLSGTEFKVDNFKIEDPVLTSDGRANIKVSVTVICVDNNDSFTGEIIFDGLGQNVPWKHWKIIRSTFGGTAVEAWCQ